MFAIMLDEFNDAACAKPVQIRCISKEALFDNLVRRYGVEIVLGVNLSMEIRWGSCTTSST